MLQCASVLYRNSAATNSVELNTWTGTKPPASTAAASVRAFLDETCGRRGRRDFCVRSGVIQRRIIAAEYALVEFPNSTMKKKISITLKCRHMHGVLNVDEIKN
jgi:hypothetical protein